MVMDAALRSWKDSRWLSVNYRTGEITVQVGEWKM